MRLRSRTPKVIESKREVDVPVIPKKSKKKIWIPLTLIAIFFLVIFMNSYFNYTAQIAYNPEGTTIGTKFFLSGPDPYYNLRQCQETLDSGYYRFVTEKDMLLNYPVGHYGSARPPLFNMIAISLASFFGNFMPVMDALGWIMLILTPIYGALLVFPVYGIGKELFNKKVGLIAAFFVVLIPIHIGSGHGSSFSLFDHDAFILLLSTLAFYFFIRSLKEKDTFKSLLFAIPAGVCIAGIQMTWVVAYTIALVILIFGVVQLIIDALKGKHDISNPLKITVVLGTAFLVSYPYSFIKSDFIAAPFYTFMGALVLLGIYLLFKKLKTPWIISLPVIGGISGIALSIFYLIHLQIIKTTSVLFAISDVIYGQGIYGQKIALTIGEAHVYSISQIVMSFGPALYWVALIGFVFFLYKTYKSKWQSYHIFFVIIFIVYFWLTTTAGRFLNDLVPFIAIFAGYTIGILVDKMNLKQMVRNIKKVGGFRGIRKGVKFIHIAGVFFIVILLITINGFLALDAAVPPQLKEKVFGEGYSGYYGTYLGTEQSWSEICYWLSQQDTEIPKPEDRPGVISWWDYGFYISSMGEHPTVADNFQEGVEPAANFHTAQTEQEATSVLIIRICEAFKSPFRTVKGTLSDDLKVVFNKYLGNNSQTFTNIIEDPVQYAPTYDTFIAPSYGNTILKVSSLNAMYHDGCDILTTNLSDAQLTELYHELTIVTGKSIRYYAIDGRDLVSIFAVFPFLSDKSTHGYVTMEDDYYVTKYVDQKTNTYYTVEQLNNLSKTDIEKMSLTTVTQEKQAYYDSFIYRAYYGIVSDTGGIPQNRVPSFLLKHWKLAIASPYVTVLKYYEGANITGTVNVGGMNYDGTVVYIFDEYQIPHDYCMVQDGKFSVTSPPGNITLKLYLGNNNLEGDQLVGEITENQALWKEEFNKTISFNVNVSSITISVNNITEPSTLNITSINYPGMQESQQVTNGNYILNNLIPSTYEFVITNSTGAEIYRSQSFLKPGENSYNITVG